MTSFPQRRFAIGLLAAVVALVLGDLLAPSYLQGELTRIWAMGIFALSLNLLLGYAGLFSLGHAAFLGVGGYTVGMLSVQFGVRDVWLGVGAALLLSALVGAVFGLIALRVRGAYFLLITFALAQVLFVLATTWDTLSPNGFGSVGITGIGSPTVGPLNVRLSSAALYYVAGAVLVGSYLLLRRFLASPLGMSVQGMRENESRMNALGYWPAARHYAVFIVAAALAGVAGALLVYHDGIATPNLFSVNMSTVVVLMVLIGGAARLAGPIVGAAVIVLAEYFASGWLPQRWPLILGAIFVAAVMLARGGVLPTVARLWERPGRVLGRSDSPGDLADSGDRGEAADSADAGDPGNPADAGDPGHPADPAAPVVDTAKIPDVTAAAQHGQVLLTVHEVVKHFYGVRAVDGVSLEVRAGERLAVIGTNGAGKSTLFNLLGGSITPDSGAVSWDGTDITGLTVRERARAGIARSFQINSLFDSLTVADNLWLAASAGQPGQWSGWRPLRGNPGIRERVAQLLGEWGLASAADRPVCTLPYGDQRRLEIAVALAARPRLLLLDEPTAGLSPEESSEFDRRLHALGRGVTVLLIAHDPELVFSMADRIIVMHQGQIVACGSSEDVRANDVVQQLYMASVVND